MELLAIYSAGDEFYTVVITYLDQSEVLTSQQDFSLEIQVSGEYSIYLLGFCAEQMCIMYRILHDNALIVTSTLPPPVILMQTAQTK